MFNQPKILAVIPARGGSKGVPRKNLRQLAGKSLLAWTFEAALGSAYLDRIILSSEDEEIMELARQIGLEVPFVRPQALAADTTPGIDPVLHAINALSANNYTHVVLLQPTSPLRQSQDIDGAIKLCLEQAAPACVSVSPAAHPPWWMFRLDAQNHLLPFMDPEQMPLRRQDAPTAYQLNGAVYVAQCAYLAQQKSFMGDKTIAYTMPQERSLDIDNELDLILAEALLKNRLQKGGA